MVRVKICGITSYRDASTAVELGAHALGFIFAPSKRQVRPEDARRIIKALPPFVQTVGVFVNEESAVLKQIRDFCGLDLIQLHGDEPPQVCREFMPRTVKALSLQDESSLEMIKPYLGNVRALLLDTYSKEERGGTGKIFDWGLAVKAREMGAPIILAGGLSPSNIEMAISTVRPLSVDINSGVEDYPGKKNPVLIKKLMDTIKKMDREV